MLAETKVACEFLFEPNDSPPILEAKRLSYPFLQQDERLDKFFTQLSLLDEVRIPIDTYKPRTLALYLDEWGEEGSVHDKPVIHWD